MVIDGYNQAHQPSKEELIRAMKIYVAEHREMARNDSAHKGVRTCWCDHAEGWQRINNYLYPVEMKTNG